MNNLVLLVIVIALFIFYHFYYKRRGWPPGPTPLPFIGNLLTITQELEGAFIKWRREYGPVYTFWLGSQPLVVIADYHTMVETLQKDADSYSDRFYMELFTLVRGGDYGVITTAGDLWRDQRRFAIHTFRDFGFGKNIMEQKVLDEVDCLIGRVNKEIDQGPHNGEIDLAAYIDVGVGSIINALMFGYRFDGDRYHEFHQLKRLVSRQMKGHWPIILMMNKPHLFKNLPYFNTELEKYMAGFNAILAFFDERIREHQKEMDKVGWEQREVTDYVFAFLKEKAQKDANDEVHHGFSMPQLQNMCLDLWLAGQETTSTTLAWGIAHLLYNPEICDKLYAELDKVIGSDRLITMADRADLPYTCAVVNETLRIANILVNAIVSNKTTRDVTVNGVLIRKGSPVLPQIAALLYDEKTFENPKAFNPARFLDENGLLKKIDGFAPFSVGKRQCLGEALARMELFLFLANIFNNFKISMGDKKPSLRRRMGVTVQCPGYRCGVQKRR
ncbi:cytochrome p450 domain-containing protein [Ditylenchus destructor]|uniref:Cytochrome p450 domain-containing protein n=1 Tax=Ditylenchus destructor TaxID=166010 RepID=A0AAD4NHJ3_9BILA|nr:cytochrome p450 domain-containing protein [Ditylenchus destructor]